MLSASVEKAWSSTLQSVENRKYLDVAVLLGDPRRKDEVKPACVFDDDDFYTLDAMKKALSEIPFMKFTFFDRHETLLDDIKKSLSCWRSFFREKISVSALSEILLHVAYCLLLKKITPPFQRISQEYVVMRQNGSRILHTGNQIYACKSP